ncbi:hypothetical protein FOA52_001963 [Chlamydomonas sp. UWO 241]|nr:hypothetical protein FOA52_001963 [Chlamydomonas sp. UWO 241]
MADRHGQASGATAASAAAAAAPATAAAALEAVAVPAPTAAAHAAPSPVPKLPQRPRRDALRVGGSASPPDDAIVARVLQGVNVDAFGVQHIDGLNNELQGLFKELVERRARAAADAAHIAQMTARAGADAAHIQQMTARAGADADHIEQVTARAGAAVAAARALQTELDALVAAGAATSGGSVAPRHAHPPRATSAPAATPTPSPGFGSQFPAPPALSVCADDLSCLEPEELFSCLELAGLSDTVIDVYLKRRLRRPPDRLGRHPDHLGRPPPPEAHPGPPRALWPPSLARIRRWGCGRDTAKRNEMQLTPEMRALCHFFKSSFFKELVELSRRGDGTGFVEPRTRKDAVTAHEHVKKWTEGVDIFVKDFLFIPIHEALHWSLIVVAHPCAENEIRRWECLVGRDHIVRRALPMKELRESAGHAAPGASPRPNGGPPRCWLDLRIHAVVLAGSHDAGSIFASLRWYLQLEFQRRAKEPGT